MDIDTFVRGITVERGDERNVPREQYADEARRTSLEGNSFTRWYRDRLTALFRNSSRSFSRHAVLNFAVQQLAVKIALHGKSSSRYVCEVSSPEDFAASLIGMIPSISATLCGERRAPMDRDTIAALLAAGYSDEVRDFEIFFGDIELHVRGSAPGSVGLLVVERLRRELLHDAASTYARSLAPGGTLLFWSDTSHELAPALLSEGLVTVFEGAAPGFGEKLVIMRRPHGS